MNIDREFNSHHQRPDEYHVISLKFDKSKIFIYAFEPEIVHNTCIHTYVHLCLNIYI